ncbi:cupin domain-containing protein [Rossellomorea vietnamensis]|uniref:cupin domain-containing protein n=1 Tax=Rossellomorea vietnamensis TaxID=218284 RepID=UPI001E43EF73|nr:cupin domain-containing protein [Rossellomorea vietnamensis]MCC5801593.1 cupin domain-containing protein [Rossellomorea vietnamensis]
MKIAELKIFYFEDDGIIPNNPDLPVLIYRNALDESSEAEEIFNRNHWLNSWTNGIYDYHHYHSNAHEVLGVMQGEATVQLGGEMGEEVTVHQGDVMVLPAGTGHKKLTASPDFKVAGAYPDGVSYNLKKGSLRERPSVLIEIKNVSLPTSDPVFGDKGPLIKYWLKK